MHRDSYSKTSSGPRSMHRNMDHESRSSYSKSRDAGGFHGDMEGSRHGMPGSMYPGMYGSMPAGMHASMSASMPPGMYPPMYGGMSGFDTPRMMEYPMDMPRRYMDRYERPTEMPYGRYMDMYQGRYMSSQDRLMNMMHNRHLYMRAMNQRRMAETMEGNMGPRGRNFYNYE